MDGPFFPHTRGNSMEIEKQPNNNDDNVGVLESASDSGAARRTRRKRKPVKGGDNSGSETEAMRGSKCHTARRGRPPKALGASIVRTRKEQRQREADFERSLSDWASQQDISDQTTDTDSVLAVNDRRENSLCSAEELRTYAGQRAASILEVATKSGHLKGTYVRKLKDAAAALTDIVESLVARTESDEVLRVKQENRQLTEEVKKLRMELQSYNKDVRELRVDLAATKKMPQVAPTSNHSVSEEVLEKLRRSIVCSVGTMIDARFAGIEERLLPAKSMRPPLAADTRRIPREHVPTVVAPPTTSEVVGIEVETRRKPRRNKTTARSEIRESAPLPNSPAEPQSRASAQVANVVENRQEEDSSWTKVVKRGKKGKKSHTPAMKSTALHPPKLKVAKPPRTKAVIITLTAEALAKGVSYAQALERAQQGINLAQLGITEGLTVRKAVSGARLLELSAAHTSEQADTLAERLQVVLEGVAVVTRPRKNATLKLLGLDDSVTKEKVVSGVVSAGGCTTDTVTVSELRLGPRGMMTAVVRCPCEAANTIAAKGRILIGWSSAKVQVLEERPLRCYRCMALGHARAQCPSTIVREHLCFRCGCEGHKSYSCRAQPHCLVCSDANRPSGHLMGGSECRPPPVKGLEALGTRTPSRADGHQGTEESIMSS